MYITSDKRFKLRDYIIIPEKFTVDNYIKGTFKDSRLMTTLKYNKDSTRPITLKTIKDSTLVITLTY